MSDTPWFKFFPSDYLSDTMGLSCCEHGVYLLLLAVSWKRGPLPDDMDHLARLAANPPIETLRFILESYWTRTEQGWLNERLEREREEMLVKHQRRVNAGRQGGQAKASNAKAMLEQCSSKALASSRSQKPEARSQTSEVRCQKSEEDAPIGALSGKGPTVRVSADDVERVLGYLNAKAGTRFQRLNGNGKESKNAGLVRARIREHGVETLLRVIDRKCESWLGDDKMRQYLRPATLFGAEKCEQYVGEAARAKPGSFLDDDPVIEGRWSRP
jgi:uncharacterized phage protein (TIGR02220 family)